MNKPGCHRTGLDAHFGGGTSMLRNASRNWPGIGGADTAPEPLALLVDNADRGRLLRYVQPNIMRHRNLRWCKSPGKMPGSRHYRLLGFEPRLPEVHTILSATTAWLQTPESSVVPCEKIESRRSAASVHRPFGPEVSLSI